jgi:hypothetical protein
MIAPTTNTLKTRKRRASSTGQPVVAVLHKFFSRRACYQSGVLVRLLNPMHNPTRAQSKAKQIESRRANRWLNTKTAVVDHLVFIEEKNIKLPN